MAVLTDRRHVHLAMEAPRLTTMLRSCFYDEGSHPFDADLQYLQRKAVIESMGELRLSSDAGVGSSSLARKVIPLWDSAPLDVRQDYFGYLQAVGELLGGESSSEEQTKSAEIIYDVLSQGGGEGEDESNESEISKSFLASARQRLLSEFIHLASDVALQKAAELAVRLHRWRATLEPNGTTMGADRTKEREEFGAELDFHEPMVEAADPASSRWWDEGEAGSATWTGGLEGVRDMDLQRMMASSLASEDSRVKPRLEGLENRDGDARGNSDYNALEGGGKLDLKWLKRMCDQAAAIGTGVQLPGDELALAVCRVLQSERPGEEIAGDLFDILGDGGLSFIEDLLKNRKELVSEWKSTLALLKEQQERLTPNAASRMPTYGTQVSVNTDSGKLIEKLRRKEVKAQARKGKGGGGDDDLDWLDIAGGFSALLEARDARPPLIDNLVGTGDMGGGLGVSALPQGTVRKTFKGYEEVHVPATKTAGLRPDEKLVEISCLDEFAQLAFDGYKTLNRIQSRIFTTAYHSNENILVCAPTGAGKTNIAMICCLHEIGQNLKYGVLQKKDFKIVYVAPMKALAAEVTAAFSRRLAPLGLAVKELTGDMQLTKRELEETQMIVTTPEKWDVITRKSSDVALAQLVKLLIVDEVHLLNDDRGPVIETLVARTLRQVESTQSMIRIVGLSATLPNYREVAQFLRVNLETGLFYFDASYRPVPLQQQYIGVSEPNIVARNNLMNEICYKKVMEAVKRGQQAMVFVHSRKDTVKTARILVELSQKGSESNIFNPVNHPQFGIRKVEVAKSRNRELGELFQSGFGCHHAGMLRSDRNLTERLFSEGLISVLVCTATLAWGVNLPAHMVVIKGTQLYDPKAGGFRELGMLDVMQIFGRAGRPQFDTSGEGIIITTHSKLSHYLRLMTHQLPIESQFITSLKDNLNAEVVLGTVTNVKEACTWLGYTYLHVRMLANPLAYGLTWEDIMMDPGLAARRKALISDAARALDKAKMLRFDEKSGNLYMTELGRVASHYYLQYTSVETYNEMLRPHMGDSELLNLIAHSSEFENIAVREEEQPELETLLRSCPVEVRQGTADKHGKVNILIQTYISRARLDSFSLVADTNYISASLGRIMRALFEICRVWRSWNSMAHMLLEYAKAADKRIWPHQHPLRQFETMLNADILYKLEARSLEFERLYDMDEKEIGSLLRHPYSGTLVAQALEHFPHISLDANISPITRQVLQITLKITPEFVWKDKIHGSAEHWWIWVESSEEEKIYHTEYFVLTKKLALEGRPHTLTFNVPISTPMPSQYYVRAISDTWLQATTVSTLSFKHLILPEHHPPHTELLDLRPLPVSALHNPIYEQRYRFSHFNPIQTQAFHTLYHTDHNVLLGAPTGSGKTISSELAMFRLFNTQPGMKVIYIAPLKALVKERLDDWKKTLVLGKKLVELTGDFTPDMRALMAADIIISTPEKWDGISRNWHNRSYTKKVGLMIIDEIHLLGADRGPILEVIVSRMRYISQQTDRPVRFVGLSTALANARDLGSWLGIKEVGLFNFKPSVRPVPLEVHIQGYPGKFYCPRMMSMNKPTYAAIMTHSPEKPVLVFVSSRRQTRLTALDLIQYAAADERPRQFLSMGENEIEMLVGQVHDASLRHTLQFGIGLHHAGLNERDRSLAEELFANNKIQVLICTSTLAWGVNLPAHLVIIKGTEYYDGKTKRYVDFPITDLLQMMGRAGRPQFDQHGKAVILAHEPKKSFLKKFLYDPFPVESSLGDVLHDHINAEIVAGTIASKQDAVDYLTWTFFFRRLVMNPSYYGLEDTGADCINQFLSSLVVSVLEALEDAGCCRVHETGEVEPLELGKITSTYYLHYTTGALFTVNIGVDTTLESLLHILCGAAEYDELPVRHNEDKLNADLAKEVRWAVDTRTLDDPHTKTNLLLQAYFGDLELPMSDYVTDTKSVLDQSIRILQAMVDVAANGGWLQTALGCMHLTQMILQGMWKDVVPALSMLPHVTDDVIKALAVARAGTLPDLLALPAQRVREIMQPVLSPSALTAFMQAWGQLPRVEMEWRLSESASREGEGEGEEKRGGWVVEVECKRRRVGRDSNTRAYVPKFPKMKEEGWWLVVGRPASKELLAMKRISFSDRLTTRLILPSDASRQSSMDTYIYLVSDCYIGLDLEQPLHFCTSAAEPKPKKAPTKSEAPKSPGVIAGARKSIPRADNLPSSSLKPTSGPSTTTITPTTEDTRASRAENPLPPEAADTFHDAGVEQDRDGDDDASDSNDEDCFFDANEGHSGGL